MDEIGMVFIKSVSGRSSSIAITCALFFFANAADGRVFSWIGLPGTGTYFITRAVFSLNAWCGMMFMIFIEMRLSLAWTGWPYAQTGARRLELVHELTHAIGLSHVGNGYGETTSNPDYPDPSGRVESYAYGFDIWEMQAVPPISELGNTHDCGLFGLILKLDRDL